MRILILFAMAVAGCQLAPAPAAAEPPSYDQALQCYGLAVRNEVHREGRDLGATPEAWKKQVRQSGAASGKAASEVPSDTGKAMGRAMVLEADLDDADAVASARARDCREIAENLATPEEASK